MNRNIAVLVPGTLRTFQWWCLEHLPESCSSTWAFWFSSAITGGVSCCAYESCATAGNTSRWKWMPQLKAETDVVKTFQDGAGWIMVESIRPFMLLYESCETPAGVDVSLVEETRKAVLASERGVGSMHSGECHDSVNVHRYTSIRQTQTIIRYGSIIHRYIIPIYIYYKDIYNDIKYTAHKVDILVFVEILLSIHRWKCLWRYISLSLSSCVSLPLSLSLAESM